LRVAFKLRKVGDTFRSKPSDQNRGSSKTGWRFYGDLVNLSSLSVLD